MPGGGAAAAGGGAGRDGYICGAAATPRPALGIMCAEPGPPTPRTGPASPWGALMGATAIPRPAALPTPGPPTALAILRRSSWGGGPSTDMDTTVSPRTSTSPSVRFSSRSSVRQHTGTAQALGCCPGTQCARLGTRTCLALDQHLSELLAVAQDQIHVLVKGHELANKLATVLYGHSHPIVDEGLWNKWMGKERLGRK